MRKSRIDVPMVNFALGSIQGENSRIEEIDWRSICFLSARWKRGQIV